MRFKAIYSRRTLLASIVLPDQVFKLNDETQYYSNILVLKIVIRQTKCFPKCLKKGETEKQIKPHTGDNVKKSHLVNHSICLRPKVNISRDLDVRCSSGLLNISFPTLWPLYHHFIAQTRYLVADQSQELL